MDKTKLEMEAGTARNIAESMAQSIDDLDRWWPPSKRGSNAQRAFDEIKAKRDAIVQCLDDGLKSP